MSKASERREQREHAMEFLRSHLKAGDTVTTVLNHVSRSGMLRVVNPVICIEGQPSSIAWAVARATEWPFDLDRGGIKVTGCGMDMGFHLVYTLSRILFDSEHPFLCSGEQERPNRCPSNDHNNERERNYTIGRQHSDGGYALQHRWL